MPYIKQRDRNILASQGAQPVTSGELNYAITMLLIQYWGGGVKNYQCINDIIGALEGAKCEFQRRVVAEFEDSKIAENGDVYPEPPATLRH